MMGEPEARGFLIFISHSSKDRWIAQQIGNLLAEKGRAHGVTIFLYENDIKVGDQITDTVRDKIIECREFVVLLSPSSVESKWVSSEIGAAWGLKKRIIAIMHYVTPEDIPPIIQNDARIDLNELDLYLAQFGERVKEAQE